MKKIVTFVFIMSMIVGILAAQELFTTNTLVGERVARETTETQNTRNLFPVSFLDYAVSGNDVTLTWGEPDYTPVPGLFHWYPESPASGANWTSTAAAEHAIRFDGPQLIALSKAGCMLSEIDVAHVALASQTFTVKIYKGGSVVGNTYNEGTLVHSQGPFALTPPPEGYFSWETIVLTNPVEIPMDEELWVVVGHSAGGGALLFARTDGGYPVSMDKYSNMIKRAGDVWKTQTSLNAVAGDNMIELYATAPTGQVISLREYTRVNDYKVYRDNTLLTTTQETTYTENIADGYYDYSVVVSYSNGDSPRTTVEVLVGTPPLNAPRNVIAVGGNETVNLSWQAPEASFCTLLGYEVYRDDELVSLTGLLTGLTFSESFLVNGVTYEYTVKAVYTRPAGKSNPSAIAYGIPQGTTLAPFAPSDLQATQYDGIVSLKWKQPIWDAVPPPGTWFSHTSYTAVDDGIGVGGAVTYGAYHRFSVAQISELGIGNRELGAIGFGAYQNPVGATWSVKVYTGGSVNGTNINPGTLVYTQAVNPGSITARTWKEVGLIEPYFINPAQELWIGVEVTTPTGNPVAIDDGEGFMHLYGNIMNWNGWTNLNTAGGGTLPYNWMIKGLVTAEDGTYVQIGSMSYDQTFDTPMISEDAGLFTKVSSPVEEYEADNTRTFMYYNIYLNDSTTPFASDITERYFDHEGASGNTTYKVTATYDNDRESAATSTSINVVPRVYITEYPNVETFTPNGIPVGWNEVDLDGDGQKWSRTATTAQQLEINGTAQGGYGLSNSRQSNILLTPDNWLMSPRYVVPTDDISVAYLNFWAGSLSATHFQEPFSVWVSTTDKQIESFTRIYQHVLNHPTNEWENINIDIMPYLTGNHVIFAIQHNSQFAEGTGTMGLKVDNITVTITCVSDVDKDIIPVKSALAGNYPNPFNPSTTIRFANAVAGHVSIDIFNVKGQKVKTLVNEDMNAGNFERVWNGTDDAGKSVGSGIYFYRMKSNDFSETQKMLLMK